MAAPPIHSTVPVVSTDDVCRSLEYYTNVLGFSRDFEFGNPVVYAGVRSGDAEIYLTLDNKLSSALRESGSHPEIFIWLSDVDAWYALQKVNGADIVEEISDRPWGARQYVVKDINGYHLKFAQPV